MAKKEYSAEEIEKILADHECLQKELTALKKNFSNLQAELDTKTTELNTLIAKYDALQEQTAKLEKDLAAKDTELTDALAINEDLTLQVETLSDGKKAETAPKKVVDIKGLTFEHNGQIIGFNFPKTVWKKQNITAEEIAASPDLQAELIAAGHGILKM